MWDYKVENTLNIGIYVDDCLVIGKEQCITRLIDNLKYHEFNLKIDKGKTDYLSCHIIESKQKYIGHYPAAFSESFDSKI
jgi:hypothetical protein